MNSSVRLPRYERSKSYRWNYDNAPDLSVVSPLIDSLIESQGFAAAKNSQNSWTFCGLPINSPLGIPAGPLLNGKWVLYYAKLGFDVLTYKTVRSRARECYPRPNLQPILDDRIPIENTARPATATEPMSQSWAISFGMPSAEPAVWRADVQRTRELLPVDKILSVSVVASPDPDWSPDQLAADYAQCAQWAMESGADCVELNFSCPNVSSLDGQVDHCPEVAARVLSIVRERVGSCKLLIKVGYFESEEKLLALLQASDGLADAVAMTNCVACRVRLDQDLLFEGQARGIGGTAILDASVQQVALSSELCKQHHISTPIVGVGGICCAADMQRYLAAGAESVQVATAAMLDPLVAFKIKSEFVRECH